MAGSTVLAQGAPARAAEMFISGHSLTDRPLPDMLEAIAESDGRTLAWERQHIGGSTIRQRSQGVDGLADAGYRAGTDRDGRPIDVLAHFSGRTAAYDLLLITEWHRVLDALVDHDTVGHLRDYQDRFIAANPAARSYFYAPWADISDRDDPGDWIAFERRASPYWQCVVEWTNVAIERKGRSDRIGFVPASAALAALAEHLAAGDTPGFRGSSAREAVDLLFSDNVHLTDTGMYFMAQVVNAAVFGADAAGDWAPAGMDGERAATLRDFASTFVRDWRAEQEKAGRAGCATVPLRFIVDYTGYMQRAYPSGNFLTSAFRRLRHIAKLFYRLRFSGAGQYSEASG